jgi:hypothetical protein
MPTGNVFPQVGFSKRHRTWVNELIDVRNMVYHHEILVADDAERALDTAYRLLSAINAAEASDIAKMRTAFQARSGSSNTEQIQPITETLDEPVPSAGARNLAKTEMPVTDDLNGGYWHDIVSSAKDVARCIKCRKWAGELGIPNPGWVGADFAPNVGIVVVLQNPGLAPIGYEQHRELQMQADLHALAEADAQNSLKIYREFAARCIEDMLGCGNPWKAWHKWKHPVSKIVEDVVPPSGLAWLNAARHRTAYNANLTPEQVRHGIEHLHADIRVLQPMAVVAVGQHAVRSLALMKSLNSSELLPPVLSIKEQGASNEEAYRLNHDLKQIVAARV